MMAGNSRALRETWPLCTGAERRDSLSDIEETPRQKPGARGMFILEHLRHLAVVSVFGYRGPCAREKGSSETPLQG